MSGQSSGQTPRTSTSSGPSHSSSSKNNVTSEVNGHRHSSSTQSHDAPGHAPNQGPIAANLGEDEPFQRRNRPRSSGGFLLQIPRETVSQSRTSTSAQPEVSELVKGKRKVEEGDIVIPKRGSTRQRHRLKASLVSSPLAIEVTNTQAAGHPNGSKGLEPNKQGSLHAIGRHGVRSSLNGNDTSGATALSVEEALKQKRGSFIGSDTDPAQIVNLALNLSESRRRNFSSGGLLVAHDSIGAGRLVSSGQPPLGLPNGAGGSLRQHLQQQRQISRNVSPRSGRSISSKGASPRLSQQESPGSRRSLAIPDFGAGMGKDIVFDASDATLARAEKARVAMELSYEYRRLLQYLPKLPTPPHSRPSTSKGMTNVQAYPSEGLGRVYNPLQYIRNRKVRFNEKRPLDSEGMGWNNIDNVRAWVDSVASGREVGISRVDRQFPLPPFDASQRGLGIVDDMRISEDLHSAMPPAKKIARPHWLWEFSSWDLLADAHWLHQEDNVMHIEDSHGCKLVTNRNLLKEDRPRTSKDSTRSPVRHSEGSIRRNGSPDRIRASFDSFCSDSKERGWRRNEVHEERSPIFDDNGSQTRRNRWTRKLIRSRSPSSSSESHRDKRRGHLRGRDQLGHREDYDHAALEKHMMDILAKEAGDSDGAIQRINEQARIDAPPDLNHLDSNIGNGNTPKAAQRRPSAPQRMRTDVPTAEKHQVPARASLDEDRFRHQRMSSDDFDSTAPNSPTASGFVPSIAINLSPPASPSTSSVLPKKTLPARLDSFRRTRSRSVNRIAVSEDDPAVESGTSANISRQTTNESQLVNMLRKERSMDPSNGYLSPIKSESSDRWTRPLGQSSIRSVKDLSSHDSRFRGLFKGGRIAELVGSEVSKVGDILWRKDSHSVSQPNSPVGSSYAVSEESDVDDGDVSVLDQSPDENISRFTSNTEGMGRLSQTSTNSDKPKYHIANLPSFLSQSNKDEQSFKSLKASPDHDHITRQQQALRRGRSTRFDRLAPPKIDMRGISPSPSPTPSPEQVETQEKSDKDSRQSSSSRFGRRVYTADRRLNSMLGIPGQVGSGGPSPTGLSALASRPGGPRGRPKLEDKRQWSISDRGVSTVHGTITKRDIARARALLLSSGVKANEISRRAEEIPVKPSPFLQDLQDLFKGQVPRLPRSQEYIFAGRMLVGNIETTAQQLKDAAEQFSHSTVENLHAQIKAINDNVNYKLTPLVRAAADDADTFSTELTTTHTLAVKQLNDSVDAILRKRRRRLRWIRRGGWAILEWTLLGIMWMVWFVVMIVRLIRGIIRGFIRGARWLFWL